MEVFKKGYNMACDSLKRYGISHYRDIVAKYCRIRMNQVDSLPKNLQFSRIVAPSQADVERAQKWLK